MSIDIVDATRGGGASIYRGLLVFLLATLAVQQVIVVGTNLWTHTSPLFTGIWSNEQHEHDPDSVAPVAFQRQGDFGDYMADPDFSLRHAQLNGEVSLEVDEDLGDLDSDLVAAASKLHSTQEDEEEELDTSNNSSLYPGLPPLSVASKSRPTTLSDPSAGLREVFDIIEDFVSEPKLSDSESDYAANGDDTTEDPLEDDAKVNQPSTSLQHSRQNVACAQYISCQVSLEC